jgi:uncharacterized protein
VLINVSQLLKSPIGSVRSYEVREVVSIAGGDSLVEGEVSLVRTDRGILAKAALNTEVEVTCSRCLSLVNCRLTLNIAEEYFPIIDAVSGTPLSLPEEPGCFTIDEHHMFDLTEAVRQYVLLAIPMKPLCREDCAGLCPACGRNLNQGPCGCLPQKASLGRSKLNKLTLQKGTE